jgi:hypothetical protein
VIGYLGEPMLRLTDQGLSVNAASPTAFSTGLVAKAQSVSGAKPVWRRVSSHRSVVWHDARAAGLANGATRGRWRIPLLVDGRRTNLEGTLRRFRRPALWPWLLLVGLLTAVAVLVLRAAGPLVQAAAIGISALAAISAAVVALAFAFDSYASAGTWIAGFDEIFFLAVGLGLLVWASASVKLYAAVGVGLLAVAVGLSKGEAFFHPIVLSVILSDATRTGLALAIGSGLGATILGCTSYVRTPQPTFGSGERRELAVLCRTAGRGATVEERWPERKTPTPRRTCRPRSQGR